MSEDHEVIYLAPECCSDRYEGRLWCKDDVWTHDCEDGAKATKYVRADRIEELEEVLQAVWEDFSDGGTIYSDTARKLYKALKEAK